MSPPPDISQWSVTVERRTGGVILVTPDRELGPYPNRLTDALDRWAERVPARTFLSQRDTNREWRCISYSEFRHAARSVARSLIDRGAAPERPVAILSGNGIDHAIVAVAALYASVPYAPVSPAYSLASADYSRLRHVVELLTPGLVFASDGAVFAGAIEAAVPRGIPVVVATNPPCGRPADLLDDLARADPAGLEETTAAVTADTVAKILFTSGSTGVPKGVITTHGMLCSNQEMLRAAFPFLTAEPPVICDWLPWHHTFGGSHNFGLVLYNGGTLYIDDGRPMGDAFEPTVQNLCEIAPTAYFNVPKGFEMLAVHLRRDCELRARFFSRLRMMFYAGAGLSQRVWDDLDDLAIETRGSWVPMLTGLGATETAPFALCASPENRRAGAIGLPVPGVRLKLAPAGDKLEARVRGPNITPGYWREPSLTRNAFDDEGYYCLGDAVRFLDPADVQRGFLFDGRLAEDFKLSTGTWVSVGPLRAHFLQHCAPHVREVVLAGPDRDEVTALLFVEPGVSPAVLERLVETFAADAPGSSTRIARAIVVEEPPSFDAGELTDKGTVNQRAVLRHRAHLVERLYAQPYAAGVLV
ncbi:MAG TPA: feruloyl-CoA synthase, partial [Bryobacteraceae bacterium]